MGQQENDRAELVEFDEVYKFAASVDYDLIADLLLERLSENDEAFNWLVDLVKESAAASLDKDELIAGMFSKLVYDATCEYIDKNYDEIVERMTGKDEEYEDH